MAMFLCCAICVCVTSNRVLCFSKDELEVFGAEEVSVNVLDAVPMNFTRILKELGEESDSK